MVPSGRNQFNPTIYITELDKLYWYIKVYISFKAEITWVIWVLRNHFNNCQSDEPVYLNHMQGVMVSSGDQEWCWEGWTRWLDKFMDTNNMCKRPQKWSTKYKAVRLSGSRCQCRGLHSLINAIYKPMTLTVYLKE